MNYRHAFHAGNYADVFKHVWLVQLLRALQRKETGFLYLDTHAGRGAYDLRSPPKASGAARAPEWPLGIGRLWESTDLPPALADYVGLVRQFNQRDGADPARLQWYPGSPWLAGLLRRPQDRMVLWEQQRAEVAALRTAFARRRRVAVEAGDGYGALRASLPPPERRALVLIDPPFEDPGEFDAVLAALREGLRRFRDGVYAVWYPVTERARADAFLAGLAALRPPPTLWTELAVTADPQVRMKACGLMVINPPWRLFDALAPLLPVLVRRLGLDRGAVARHGWLVPEK
jgi:23S rRNA (adenine2030-N6)-methyltransferase